MPHVLLVVENVPLGIDTRVRKEVRDLLSAGYRVSVITQAAPENEEYRRLPGLTVLEYPRQPEPRGLLGYVREYAVSFAWVAIRSISAGLRSRVDVVHVVQPPDIWFPLTWLHKRLGAAVLVDQHDLMPEMLRTRQDRAVPGMVLCLRALERWTQRVADATVCTNDYQRERLVAAGADPNRVTVVRNGPVLSRVRDAAPDESLRDGRRFLCCWAGKMGRQDRLDLVLQAIHHVVRELGREDVRFVFLGDGECLAESQALASDLGLDPWVSFRGWVPEAEVFSCLATADLGIDASLQDDVTPVKVLEYLAFGVPFVSFDLRETRGPGADAGAYVPPGDVAALARELVALLDDPDRRTAMGALGRRRMREELAWEHQAKAYVAVMDRLSHRARRTPCEPGGDEHGPPAIPLDGTEQQEVRA